MSKQELLQNLGAIEQYFERSTRCLKEQNSTYAPGEGAFTVAQQVAHVAQTIDWFVEGAFRPEGFDMNFAKLDADARAVDSLAAAREWAVSAFGRAREVIASKSEQEMAKPLPKGGIMGGVPRSAIVDSIADHTAHHRGSLTVYSRLLGLTPAMPYMET